MTSPATGQESSDVGNEQTDSLGTEWMMCLKWCVCGAAGNAADSKQQQDTGLERPPPALKALRVSGPEILL